MKEVFEKIKERLEEASWNTMSTFDEDGFSNDDSEEVVLTDRAIEIVNQVESEYQSTVGQVKCDASFSDGYIKGIDDAIEKFLEYGCFCIEWNPKLSKEKLVDDVMRQVRGQSVYILEKLKQKAEEYNQSLANNNQSLTNGGWIPVSSGNLPKEGQVVNATILIESQQRRFVTQVMYGSWWLNSDKRMIAWKPLEEPYEGE